MSRSALYRGVFGGAKQDFVLNIGELEELQEQCDAGPEEIFHRISEGRWRLADIRETLRLGLKGGGMDPDMAMVMVARYASPGQLAVHKPLVTCILSAALVGAPDEDAPPSGEKKGGRGRRRSPAAKSASASSTKSAARSATRPTKSPAAPSGD